MKQLMNCRYEATAERLNKLLSAARDENIVDIDAEINVPGTGSMLEKIREDKKTEQSLTHISHTLNKYVDGMHEITGASFYRTVRQQLETPSLKRLLNDDTLNIFKAVRPPLQMLQTA